MCVVFNLIFLFEGWPSRFRRPVEWGRNTLESGTNTFENSVRSFPTMGHDRAALGCHLAQGLRETSWASHGDLWGHGASTLPHKSSWVSLGLMRHNRTNHTNHTIGQIYIQTNKSDRHTTTFIKTAVGGPALRYLHARARQGLWSEMGLVQFGPCSI